MTDDMTEWNNLSYKRLQRGPKTEIQVGPNLLITNDTDVALTKRK